MKILPRGIRLTFGGYNEKLQKFASYISSKLANDFRAILPKTDVEFERYKDQVMRALSAFDVKQPYGTHRSMALSAISDLYSSHISQRMHRTTVSSRCSPDVSSIETERYAMRPES